MVLGRWWALTVGRRAMTYAFRRFVALSALIALAPGCVISASGSGTDPDDADDPTAGESELHALEACRGEASDEDLEEAVVIVGDYDQSIHEMVACGGLSVVLVSAITSGIVEAIIDNKSDATPDEWEFQDDGVYFTNSAMADMEARFYLAEDFAFGKAGDPLTENLFLVSTYLTGARVEIEFDINDPLSTSGELHFDGVGPYVELLGYGPDPQSPINITTQTWNNIQDNLAAIEFDSDVQVADTQSKSTVLYHVTTNRAPASTLLTGGSMGFELQMADASRGDLSQNLVVENWGIDFVDQGGGALDGAIDFRVEGGPLDYEGSLVYDNSTFGDPELRCPQ